MNASKVLKVRAPFTNQLRYKSKSSAEYCLDCVRQHDYENFMCILLLESTARSVALAVRSFNVEISRIGEQVSQETTGLMRLQFWEDMIEGCYVKDTMGVPKHPVAIELKKAITAGKLTKRYLKNLIMCRKDTLKVASFASLESAEKYAEQSVSNVYYLMLEGSGVKNVHADHAASHLGKAQGLVQQLRSTPLSKRLNIMPLPQDILTKNKVSHEEILRGAASDRLNECTFEVASRAYQHLTKARGLIDNVPAEGRRILLPAIPVAYYLQKLQSVHYDVLHPSLQQKSRTWVPKLWINYIRKKY